MKIAAICKFCEKPLELEVDDTYAALGDKYKLLRLAACDSCADYRQEQLIIVRKIKAIAVKLFQRLITDGDAKNRAREVIERQLKNYLRLVADHKGVDAPAWDAEPADLIMERPETYMEVIKLLHAQHFDNPRQAQLV